MDADFEEAEKNHVAAHCLTNFATVVDLLLEYLTSKQLCAAACVCWFWNVSAKRIKSKRKKVLTKLIGIPEEDEDEVNICKYFQGRNSRGENVLWLLKTNEEFAPTISLYKSINL